MLNFKRRIHDFTDFFLPPRRVLLFFLVEFKPTAEFPKRILSGEHYVAFLQ